MIDACCFMNPPTTPLSEAGTDIMSKTLAIKAIGVGSAGINVLEQIIKQHSGGIASAAINTDAPSLVASSAAEKVHLESKLLRGLIAGHSTESGHPQLEEHLPKLQAMCKGVDVVFILAGLGGVA